MTIGQTRQTPKPHNTTTSASKTRQTPSDLSKNLIQKDFKATRVQKLKLINVDKSNSPIRDYFRKYSQIAPQRQVDRMSKSFVQQVNSDDFLKLYPQDYFRGFSLLGEKDLDRVNYEKIFEQLKKVEFAQAQMKSLDLKLKQSRAIGSMLGLAICDALGAPLQFSPFRRNGYNHNFTNFSQLKALVQQKQIMPKFGQAGIWTDDFSMALALSYNFILNNYKFTNPEHLRFMFHLWWYHGLGNGNRDESVGLGRNISISMDEFVQYERRYVQLGQLKQEKGRQMQYLNPQSKQDKLSINKLQKVTPGNMDNNGNGSLMRLAPCAVLHYNSVQRAMQVAAQQSLTTHNGLEAKQCCRLLVKIIVDMINRPKHQDWKQALIKSCEQFESPLYQVQFLARGWQQTQEMFDKKRTDPYQPRFKQFNRSINDRKWNWRDPQFNYSPTRYNQNFQYIGSYCMDGLSMALHCVYHTNSFKQCALKCAKLGGDCDTVGAIAGQISGAIYGVTSEMLQPYSGMDDFTQKRYEAFLIAKKLANQGRVMDGEGCWGWVLNAFEKIRRYFYWRSDSESAY